MLDEQEMQISQNRLGIENNETEMQVSDVQLDFTPRDPYSEIKRKKTEWDNDATNGLSYSRLVHFMNKTHPRIVSGRNDVSSSSKAKYTRYPVCKTRTGSHCCWKSWRENDM